MLVNLARDFRAADGIVRKTEDNPHELPDDTVLPSGAEKLSAKTAKEAVKASEEE